MGKKMSKCIRVLQTDNDFDIFKYLLYNQGIKIYTYHVEKLCVEQIKLSELTGIAFRMLPENITPIVSRVGKYNIFSEDSSYIESNPCLTKNGQVLEGTFILHKGAFEDDRYRRLNSIFILMKKKIRDEYVLSDDKSCYIGCDFLNKWVNREISATFILKKKELKLINNDISRYSFFKFLKDEGYQLRSVIDKESNENSSFLAIYSNDLDLTKISNGRKTRLSLDSNCVFLSREEKGDSVILDVRLFYEDKSAKYIYNNIINYVEQNYKLCEGVYVR